MVMARPTCYLGDSSAKRMERIQSKVGDTEAQEITFGRDDCDCGACRETEPGCELHQRSPTLLARLHWKNIAFGLRHMRALSIDFIWLKSHPARTSSFAAKPSKVSNVCKGQSQRSRG